MKKYGITPAYSGYGAYDEVYYIADAIHRAGSTDPDKMVTALEQTDWVGTVGRITFYGNDDPYTHAMEYGKDKVSGLFVQWQDGKQVPIWPASVAGTNTLKFPSFVKLTN
jgi:branched-chain amino acid transport system substrate-binding protein